MQIYDKDYSKTNKKRKKQYSFFEITVIIILLAILAAFLTVDYRTRQMIKEFDWHEDYMIAHSEEYEIFKEYKELLDFKELERVEHIYE